MRNPRAFVRGDPGFEDLAKFHRDNPRGFCETQWMMLQSNHPGFLDEPSQLDLQRDNCEVKLTCIHSAAQESTRGPLAR